MIRTLGNDYETIDYCIINNELAEFSFKSIYASQDTPFKIRLIMKW